MAFVTRDAKLVKGIGVPAVKKSAFSDAIAPAAVLSRLMQVYGAADDSQLAIKMGKPRSTVGNWRARQSVPFEDLSVVAVQKNVSMDWLLFGRNEGEPLRVAEDRAGSYGESDFDARVKEFGAARDAIMDVLGRAPEHVSERGMALLLELAWKYQLDRPAIELISEICKTAGPGARARSEAEINV